MTINKIAPATIDRDTDYALTISSATKPLKDYTGQTIPVKAMALLEDVSENGEVIVIARIMDDDGIVYGTSSKSFVRALTGAWEYAERWKIGIEALKIMTGRSRNGRDYLTCNPVFTE